MHNRPTLIWIVCPGYEGRSPDAAENLRVPYRLHGLDSRGKIQEGSKQTHKAGWLGSEPGRLFLGRLVETVCSLSRQIKSGKSVAPLQTAGSQTRNWKEWHMNCITLHRLLLCIGSFIASSGHSFYVSLWLCQMSWDFGCQVLLCNPLLVPNSSVI